jgi:hypothetical protein
MFEPLLDTAHGLRRFLTESGRRAKAVFEWLQEAGSPNEARGLRLLREWLSAEQRAQFDAKGYFDVTGCDSGRRYRIRRGTNMNVYEIDQSGRARAGWCFVPDADLVSGDVMLAQKIALETDERGALMVAKGFSLR